MSLNKYLSFLIIPGSLLFSLGVYIWGRASLSSELLQIIRLQQIFALTALFFLYLAMLVDPLYFCFKSLPFKNQISSFKNPFIVSAFYFGLLHGLISFFGQLGGFEGLGFLSNNYLIAITLSFTSLMILTILSALSLTWITTKFRFLKWKFFGILLYLSGILTLIHAVMLGTHFQDLSSTVPEILFAGLALLLLLEALRFDTWFQSKAFLYPRFGFTFTVAAAVVMAYTFAALVPADSPLSLGIHSQHIELAKQAQNGNTPNGNLPNIPGLKGDRTKRFTVDSQIPENIKPNEEVEIKFKVYDASSGNQVSLFETVYEKNMHLIIVDKELGFFNHIHPQQTADGFTVRTSFPKEGIYHLYTDFQPLGAIEQQFGFNLKVGNPASIQTSAALPDDNLTKTFGDYEITLGFPKPLLASKLSIGQQELTFTVKDAKTKQPVTNLKPYLASFGHLVMINQKTFDYLHVHPTNLVPPKPDENGGPEVKFLPLGIYGPIKPGIYKVFAQFNPNNNLMTADFMVEIK